MDPVRDMMMTCDDSSSNSNQLNNVITLEEGIDCRELNSRFFSLFNHESKLNVIISKSSSIISCKLDGQEIVVDQRLYQQSHETCAVSDRPLQKIDSLQLLPHVRGAELFLSTPNGASSIMYELTRQNHLNSIVKLKSIHLQQQVTYFNLKNAKQKVSIDGHTLVVQCNGNMNRIQFQPTKLLCQCNKNSTILPQSLIGEIPFHLTQHQDADVESNDGQNAAACAQDDMIVCDAIFSLESTCPIDVLKIQLQYENRVLIFETRSSQSCLPNGSASMASTSGVSSSSSTSNKNSYIKGKSRCGSLDSTNVQVNDSIHIKPEPQALVETSNSSQSEVTDYSQDRSWLLRDIKPPIATTAPSTSNCHSNITQPTTSSDTTNNNKPSTSSALSHPATILRVRVRVTNFGVCIMPIMMTNYKCTYKFLN